MGLIALVASYLRPDVNHLIDEVDSSCILYLPVYKLPSEAFYSRDRNQRLFTNAGSLWTSLGRSFDGVDDKISSAHISELDGASAFTCIAQFMVTGLTSRRVLLSPNAGPGDRQLSCYVQSNGRLGFEVQTAGGSSTCNSLAGSIQTNTWYHVAMIFDGMNAVLRSYINGKQQTVTLAGQPVPSSLLTAAGSMVVGSEEGGVFYKGLIDEIRLYTRVMYPAEVEQDYLASKWRY